MANVFLTLHIGLETVDAVVITKKYFSPLFTMYGRAVVQVQIIFKKMYLIFVNFLSIMKWSLSVMCKYLRVAKMKFAMGTGDCISSLFFRYFSNSNSTFLFKFHIPFCAVYQYQARQLFQLFLNVFSNQRTEIDMSKTTYCSPLNIV